MLEVTLGQWIEILMKQLRIYNGKESCICPTATGTEKRGERCPHHFKIDRRIIPPTLPHPPLRILTFLSWTDELGSFNQSGSFVLAK